MDVSSLFLLLDLFQTFPVYIKCKISFKVVKSLLSRNFCTMKSFFLQKFVFGLINIHILDLMLGNVNMHCMR